MQQIYAERAPIIAPPITSEGKCIIRYILENAVRTAKVIAAHAKRAFRIISTEAAETAFIVCPEGKEYGSIEGGTSKTILGSNV